MSTKVEVLTPDGIRLAAHCDGAGEPVLLLHGLGFTQSLWETARATLEEANFRVVTYDLRGFGKSEHPKQPYTMNTLVADLESVADHFRLDRFHLVGHSLGGMCAQLFALEHPTRVRSLTLVSATSHSGQRGSAYGAALSYLARHGFDKAMENESFRQKIETAIVFLSDPTVRSQLDGTLSHELPTGEELLALIKRMTPEANPARSYAWSCTVGFTTRDRLNEIQCPSFVLHGTKDMIIPYVAGQLLGKGLQGSRWMSFQGAGHSLPRERQDEFTGALVDFLGSLAA
ncbi:MAG TPA: hypothetical protein DIU15_06600 [Deltaproteobacteria bacterium]|nr:hypothetical protein [Deltaproteobacteria bacterium]HCP45691.1 hypothetical protein [Deltaproteobacteria bacterium]|tara:strand:- start:480 stop:1340 length:861 start_codon:yes stop_codon:yes gene_type:complete